MFVATQRLGKYVPAATNAKATVKGLLGNDVFCWAAPKLYNEDLRSADLIIPCGGGVEYLHSSLASSRRDEKGTQCLGV
jgi:hypothetical protein